MKKTIIICASLLMIPSAGLADRLPDSARKLTAEEARAIYSGRSIKWETAYGYFAPDGKFYGVTHDKEAVGEGTWSVRGNKVCYRSKWRRLDGTERKNSGHCWSYWKDGRTYWTQWDGARGRNDYYTDEKGKLSRRDRVTRTYNRLVQK